MLFLGKEEIEKLTDPQEMMDQIEEAYRIFGADEYYMPPRPVIEHENKTLIYMPCYTKSIIGTKMLTISRKMQNLDCRLSMALLSSMTR